jgi:hypothetical protein
MRRHRGIHKPVNGWGPAGTIGPRGHGRRSSVSGPRLKDRPAAGAADHWAPEAVFARVAGRGSRREPVAVALLVGHYDPDRPRPEA